MKLNHYHSPQSENVTMSQQLIIIRHYYCNRVEMLKPLTTLLGYYHVMSTSQIRFSLTVVVALKPWREPLHVVIDRLVQTMTVRMQSVSSESIHTQNRRHIATVHRGDAVKPVVSVITSLH